MFHSKDSLVILIIDRIAKPWGWKKLQVGVNLCPTPTIAYCEGCIKKISNVQKPISDGKPLKVAQHSNLDNVKTLTFYVHTSMYKSEQAVMQGWEHFGRLEFKSPKMFSSLHYSLLWFIHRSMNIKCQSFDIIQVGMLCYFQRLSIRNRFLHIWYFLYAAFTICNGWRGTQIYTNLKFLSTSWFGNSINNKDNKWVLWMKH